MTAVRARSSIVIAVITRDSYRINNMARVCLDSSTYRYKDRCMHLTMQNRFRHTDLINMSILSKCMYSTATGRRINIFPSVERDMAWRFLLKVLS